jgi:hypothetical protein
VKRPLAILWMPGGSVFDVTARSQGFDRLGLQTALVLVSARRRDTQAMRWARRALWAASLRLWAPSTVRIADT